jgi:hypothetical protein
MLHTIDEHKFYYPYKSSRKQKKFMVLINDDGQIKWVHFGDKKYEHYTEGHLDEQRKINYDKRNINRDKERNNYNSAAFWAYWYLWKYPTYKEAYEHIKLKILKKYLK